MERHISELARFVSEFIGIDSGVQSPVKNAAVRTPSSPSSVSEQPSSGSPLLETLREELQSGHPIIPLARARNTSDSLAAPCFIIVEGLGHDDLSALSRLTRSLKKNAKGQGRSLVLASMTAFTGTAELNDISMVLTATELGILEDLAIATGGRCLSKDLGIKLDSLLIEDCGSAQRIQLLKSGVRVIGAAGKQSHIDFRAKMLTGGYGGSGASKSENCSGCGTRV